MSFLDIIYKAFIVGIVDAIKRRPNFNTTNMSKLKDQGINSLND